MKTAPCSGCRRPIRWRTTPAGALMPLDAEPLSEWKPGAYIILSDEDCAPAPKPVPLLPDDPAPIYMNHWATCTAAGRFKRMKT